MVVVIEEDNNDVVLTPQSNSDINTNVLSADEESKCEKSDNNDYNYNILINAKQLKQFIENNFHCKHCSKVGKRSNVCVTFKTFGIATKLSCVCKKKTKEKRNMNPVFLLR